VAARPVDLVNAADKYAAALRRFYLDVKSWQTFNTSHALQWDKCRFTKDNRAQIPRERGLYVFTLELSPSELPAHGYILYIGIVGDKNDRTLYDRYGDYLRNLRTLLGRPRVIYMLSKWDGHLFFNFVPLSNKAISLANIEQDFLDAVNPPVNQTDFSADVRAARTAAWL